MTAEKYAASLRLIAEFVESRPELFEGGDLRVDAFTDSPARFYARDAAHVAAFARALGNVEKEYSDGGLFYLRRPFGEITVEVFANRGNVCRKVVKGTRVIPETVIPAQPEQVIPEREEEIVEWECAPILAGGAS